MLQYKADHFSRRPVFQILFLKQDAEKNCPQRWKSFQAWKENNTNIMKEAKGFLKDLFYLEGPNKTTPDCPVKIVADYDPTNGKATLT